MRGCIHLHCCHGTTIRVRQPVHTDMQLRARLPPNNLASTRPEKPCGAGEPPKRHSARHAHLVGQAAGDEGAEEDGEDLGEWGGGIQNL